MNFLFPDLHYTMNYFTINTLMFPLPNIILYFKFSLYNQEAKNNTKMVFSYVFFRTIERILFIIDDAHGNPVTAIQDAAIPKDVINEFHRLRIVCGMTTNAAVIQLRNSLVPAGYDPYPLRPRTVESLVDKLRSLVSTYRFRHAVRKYKEEGVDFSLFLYVPEFCVETGDYFHEREDHCHILKRIWKHTRETGPRGSNLGGFDEAMRDPTTSLTQAALTGECQQSVKDAERMLLYSVAKFLKDNGYDMEGEYVEIVAGWHEAADGRGLTELKCCKNNYLMLNMILDEWMPWHQQTYDFSTIDINRYRS